MGKYLTEFIGTMFLVLVIGLVVGQNVALAAVAIGTILMVMVYMGGHVSGAHYNPAITLGLLARARISVKDAVIYWIVQLAGGVAGALVSWYLIGHTFSPAPGPGVSAGQALTVEALFSFALVLVVLNVAATKATAGNSYFGLAIGFTVLAGALAGGAISGGAFNPAVGIGPILVEAVDGHSQPLSNLWLYLAGPLAGGLLAAAVHGLQVQE